MAYKKTDKCCRYRRWRGWGKTFPKQEYDDKMVCLKKPKTFKQDEFNELLAACHVTLQNQTKVDINEIINQLKQ